MNRSVVAIASSVIGMLGTGGVATLSFATGRSPECLQKIESQMLAQIERSCGQMTTLDFLLIAFLGVVIFVVIQFGPEILDLPSRISASASDRN